MPFDFTNKNVFVFGGTSGINLGIAKSFARAGANLAVASRSQDKVDAAVASLHGQKQALGFSLDVRDFDAVKAAIEQFRAERGTIDAVIEPETTRAEIHAALEMLISKREKLPRRRHDNTRARVE